METWNRRGKAAIGLLLMASLVLAGPGCRGMNGGRRMVAAAEPPLLDPYAADESLIAEAPTPQMTFVDRHPVLSKPRYYYQSSGDNPLVKAGAATLIGIPAGVLGEMRQIVVGTPRDAHPY